jgi:hypothetical protein
MLSIVLPGGRFLSGAIAASFTTAVRSAELYLSEILKSYCMSDLEIEELTVCKSLAI